MKQNIPKYLKWILPVLFIIYYSNTVIFMHSHVEDGYVILHAHHFSEEDGGEAHEHTSLKEMFFFHELSTIHIADGVISPLPFQLFDQLLTTTIEGRLYPSYLTSFSKNLYLRAPPISA